MARKTPKFATEALEAAWWDKHRAELDTDFEEMARKGQLRLLDKEQLAARTGRPARVISIRLPDDDLALARDQASRKGLPYQTYIKSLLHEALRRAR
jgi:predicted DNA binding CopG/RHH family protein